MSTAVRQQTIEEVSQPASRPRSKLKRRQLKILHIINDLSIGGAEMMLYKLLCDRDPDRIQPHVVSLRSSGSLLERLGELGLPVTNVGLNSHLQTTSAAWRLGRLIKQLEPDVIQGWMYHGNLAAQFAAASARTRTPVIWSIRQSIYSLQHEKKSTLLAIRLGARLSAKPQAIVYNSRVSAAQHGALGYHSDNTFVIPNGFDTEIFAPSDEARRSVRGELNLPPNALLIGMIGRFHPAKDHETFLRAAALLNKSGDAHRFVLCGMNVDAGNSYLQNLIGRLGLQSRTLLLGQRDDIDRLMPALDVVVSSSFEEGFPNVIGEAMASAVPCVVTDVSDLPWVVGNTGVVVPSRNSQALACGIQTMIELAPEERARIGVAARQRVIEKFQIQRIKKLYEDLYEDLLTSKQTVRSSTPTLFGVRSSGWNSGLPVEPEASAAFTQSGSLLPEV